jgi:hypothetical protein
VRSIFNASAQHFDVVFEFADVCVASVELLLDTFAAVAFRLVAALGCGDAVV